jgi:hypothetical protein
MARRWTGLVLGIAVVGALVLSACALRGSGGGAAGDPGAVPAGAADIGSPEGRVLAAMGYDTADLAVADQAMTQVEATPSAGPGAGHGPGRKRRIARVWLARHVLHGEAVVETPNGNKTVDVQRGTVTAIDDKSVTVKSSDGFTQTWTFGSPIHVVQHRTTVQPGAITVGTQIGIAGLKEGSTLTARLIVVPKQ